MKLLLIAGLALLPFCNQKDGSAAGHPFLKEALATDKGVEPLTDSALISLQNRNLILEPGVRAQKIDFVRPPGADDRPRFIEIVR